MRKSSFKQMVTTFALMCEGTIAVAFGILAPVLIGAVGVSMDVSQAYLVRQRLHGALDAAALAAAATSEDADEIEQRVRDFLEANYPAGKIGILNDDQIQVDVTESEVHVAAAATFNTTFMRVLGYDHISVSSEATVARELKGLEVVLVLDNTGSLGSTNMASVKTAATNFITILFDRVEEADDIKIGLVPYASSVNVGRYGLGQNPDGTAGYGTPFVTLPSGISYTTSHGSSSGWYGCVTEHMSTNYDSAATHITGSRGQLWSTDVSPNDTKCVTGLCQGHGWRPDITTNDPYPNDAEDSYAGPWDIYSYGKVITAGVAGPNSSTDYGSGAPNTCGSGYTCNDCYSSTSTPRNLRRTCRQAHCFCSYSTPNENCPYGKVMPMASDEAALLAEVNNMDDHGYTYSNIGMAWGMRVLSPDEPFIEGSDWGDENWNKAIVLMTDGEMFPNSTYSGYWASARTADSISSTANVDEMNDRLLEVCSWLKAEPRNVIIYTITFDHATSDITEETKEIYRQCATDSDHYFEAPSQAQLITAFEQISGALANLHLKQ